VHGQGGVGEAMNNQPVGVGGGGSQAKEAVMCRAAGLVWPGAARAAV